MSAIKTYISWIGECVGEVAGEEELMKQEISHNSGTS